VTPTTLLPGFSESTVIAGINAPTAMDFSPDGRLWVLEQGGQVKLVHNDGTTFTALQLLVDSTGERGLLGIAFDPNFTSNHFVYLYYTNPSAGAAPWAAGEHNQMSRFTVNDINPLQPTFTKEAPILDLNTLVGATNHNGGAIHFGGDGMLYVGVGDNTQTFIGPDGNAYRVSQTLADLLGKELRMNVSSFNSGMATRDDTTVGHLIPANNPFVGQATGINQLIYALGLRNPFTLAVQPGTRRILINDVGETTWEEIDDGVAGANYGWSGGNSDGFGHPPPSFAPGTYHDPLLAYAHSGLASLATGAAIVGGTFYDPATESFPSSYVGMYFYEDLSSGWIRYFNPSTPNSASSPDGNSIAFATNTPGNLRDLTVDAAGNLYYLSGTDGTIRMISFQAPPNTLANQQFVAQVYRDLLHREADTAGLAGWTSAVDHGATRTQVVLQVESSAEYLDGVVQQLYSQLLHRAADPAGLQSAVTFLQSGGTDEQLAAALAGSAEYFQVRGGGSNDSFLIALYQDALTRQPDAAGRRPSASNWRAGSGPRRSRPRSSAARSIGEMWLGATIPASWGAPRTRPACGLSSDYWIRGERSSR
jgi:glucose/arabinose dehydrogenase